jgi:hypothetical protein
MRDIFIKIRNEWSGQGQFLGRGNFSELIFSIAEVCIGTHILLVGRHGDETSILLAKIHEDIPVRVIGVCFFVSGIITLTGITLLWFGYTTKNGYTVERLLRFLGALGSIFVWMAAAFTLTPSPFAYIYYMAAIAGMRVTRIVWRN